MSVVIGWDIGGAHLKIVRCENGVVTAARQIACPLWLGVDRLDAALAEAAALWPGPATHALTMTAELADVFPDRATGVGAVLDAVAARLRGVLRIYALGDFLSPAEARRRANRVASANWHATAMLAARAVGDGLLVDIGSTTTDLVPLRAGRVAAEGMSDFARLACGELLYRGVVRTPVMAIVHQLRVAGERVGVMAELFATTADVFRLTAALPPAADQHATADGRGKSLPESRTRLARMVGRDAGSAPEAVWDDLARQVAAAMLREIARTAGRFALPPSAPVLGAGIGRFLAAALARRLRRPYRDLAALIPATSPAVGAAAADHAPAAAVALLLATARRSRATAAASSGAVRPPAVSAERKPRKSGRSGSSSGRSPTPSDPASPARSPRRRARSRKSASAGSGR
jgi:probable H4MPT-linked C1 transfer pathway protein